MELELFISQCLPALRLQLHLTTIAGDEHTAELGLGDVTDEAYTLHLAHLFVVGERHGEQEFIVFTAVEGTGGDIHIELYYFADRISDSRNNAGGGTRGTPILDHIEQTKPTNVIVITDADISDCSRVVTVPGAVWMLFYGGRSSNLMDHLKGKRQNKYYDIDYSKL